MDYSKNENQVVFLKDTDIVQDISGNNALGDAVLSNGIASYDLVSAISGTTSADVEFLSGKLSTLSGRFDTEQAYTSAALRYQGEVTLSNEYNYGDITVNKKLVALIVSNSNISSHTAKLNAGFLFKAVAGDPTSTVYEFDDINMVFHPNDYIFINKNKDAVSDITSADINIIRDYDLSVSSLQSAINELTATVSADETGLIDKLDSLSTKLLEDELGLIPILSDDLSTLSDNALTSAQNLSNAITAISDVISAPTVGINARVNEISNLVISNSDSLSNKYIRLSTDLLSTNGFIPELCTTVTATLSTKLTDLISTTNVSATELTNAITAICADVKGGVNYKGHLKLNMFNDPYDLSTYVALVHGGTYTGETITIPPEVENKELNNGWMYYISLTGNETNPAPSSYTTKDEIKFVPGNYIIVHAHNVSGDADVALSSVKICDIKRENIDIIQVTDSDLVRFQNLNDVSNALCTSTTALVSSISNTLSTALTNHIGDYNQLCTTLSTNISALSIDVHTTVSNSIDNKVILSSLDTAGGAETKQISTLIINRMTAAQYAENVARDNIADDLLYSITDDDMNAYGKRIVSVATPVHDEDAANKKYVDDNIDALSVDDLSTRFDNAFTTGANKDEILTLFNSGDQNYKYLLLMLSGTLVLKLKAE